MFTPPSAPQTPYGSPLGEGGRMVQRFRKGLLRRLGCLALIFLLVTAVVGFIAVQVAMRSWANVGELDLISSHGFGQYARNLIHLDASGLYRVKAGTVRCYAEPMSMAQAEQSQPLATFSRGQRFAYRGYRSHGEVTWLAAQVWRGQERISCFGLLAEAWKGQALLRGGKSDLVEPVNEAPMAARQQREFVALVQEKARLVVVPRQDRIQLQKYRESDDWAEISGLMAPEGSPAAKVGRSYFVPAAQEDWVEQTHERTLDRVRIWERAAQLAAPAAPNAAPVPVRGRRRPRALKAPRVPRAPQVVPQRPGKNRGGR